jgi:hypothetical protein
MKEFFKKELETLQAKTGIRQFETIMAKDNWEEEVDALINPMLEECNRPPFNIVKPEVKERVIRDAILNDQEFIGLNAKFVRKALNAWWGIYGGKILEAVNQKSEGVYKKVPLTPEEDAKVNVLLDSYKKRLLSGGPAFEIKKVPQLTEAEIKEEGQVERKKTVVRSTPLSYHESQERHRRYVLENYDMYTGKQLPTWMPEDEWNKLQKP